MAKVMVTGASSGLGTEIAKQFARRGDDVIVVARRQAILEELCAELLSLGASKTAVRVVDLADEEQVQELADDLPELGVEVLINNAALGHWDYTWDTAPQTMRYMIELNVSAVAVLTAAFSKFSHTQPARLMNVASAAGYFLYDGAIPYSASKYFVTALTEGLARELASQGHPMRAQLLAPRGMPTEFLTHSLNESKMVFEEADLAGVKFNTAAEVAEYAMQLYDSDAVVGAVQPDMSFKLSGGLHEIGYF